MKISIIVPVYNVEKYLNQCVDSLINQTFKDIEIILVDDGSTDSSGKICDEYAAADERVKVIHKANSGLTDTWKTGVSVSTGRYILFVDSDDWVDTDMLERMAGLTSGRNDEIIVSDYIIERNDGTQTYVYQALKPGKYNRKEILADVLPSMWGHENRILHTSRCMKLFAARLIKDNEQYSKPGLRFGEDNVLSIPCIMDCGRLVVMEKAAMYHYRYVNSSMVHNYDATLLDSITLLQRLLEEAIKDKFCGEMAKEYEEGYGNKLLEAVWTEWPFFLIYAMKNEVRGKKEEYINSIQKLVLESKNRQIIKTADISIKNKANKLIFYVMKHPTAINCRILRLAMRIKG